MTGIIMEGRGGFYTVETQSGERHILRAQKKIRREGLSPLVGDTVHFSPQDKEEHGWVLDIVPRRNCLVRPPCANVEKMCIVLAPAPKPDWLLVDKLLYFACLYDIQAALVINKCEMDDGTVRQAEDSYARFGTAVYAVSAKEGTGLDRLKSDLAGGIVCFTGQSGVGKSTLLSVILETDLQTGDISRKIQRGKQTTRHQTLFRKEGLWVLDTPGFSLFDLPVMSPEDFESRMADFAPYRGGCRFTPCLHDREPGCAVKKAVAEGALCAERYQRYVTLLNTQKELWKERYRGN